MAVESSEPASAPTGAVFLSYASQDAEAARRICDALRASGIEVWFDQSELRGGDVWDQKIRRQIHDCALFIPVISANTASRREGYFRLEWDLADQRSHRMARDQAFIVPVCLDATLGAGTDVPESFHRVQWTRLPGGETPPAFVERVQRLLAPTGPAELAHQSIGVVSPTDAQGREKPKWRWPAFLVVALLSIAGGAYLARERLLPSMHTAPAATAIAEKSIAVLPFADLSEQHNQEYFADGMAEELLDLLSQVPDLSVAARTSSFYFKGKSEDLTTIAQKLRVAHILEGSVRKAGARIRVTVQLIRAENGYHLWSKTYDRSAEDVFKVQDEIAAAVVEALKARLLPTQQVVNQHRTGNLDAYAQYLLGNQLRARDTTESNQQALVAYRRAVELDPSYAAAYSGLAESEWRVADQTTGEAAAYERAAAAADRAVALAPASPDGYWARGTLRYLNSFDWNGARADFQKALALDASDVRTLVSYGRLEGTLKRMPEAVALTRRALALDPLSGEAWDWMAFYFLGSGQLPAARDAVAHRNHVPSINGIDWQIELIAGEPGAALNLAQRADREIALWGSALAEHSLGHAAESQRALDILIEDRADTWAYQIAEAYAWRGEREQAFQWLEQSYRQRDAGVTRLAIDPFLKSLHDDPRLKALLSRMKLPE